jgi:hypothetical protein
VSCSCEAVQKGWPKGIRPKAMSVVGPPGCPCRPISACPASSPPWRDGPPPLLAPTRVKTAILFASVHQLSGISSILWLSTSLKRSGNGCSHRLCGSFCIGHPRAAGALLCFVGWGFENAAIGEDSGKLCVGRQSECGTSMNFVCVWSCLSVPI